HKRVEVSLGLRNESMAQVLDGLDVGEEVDLAWLQDPAAVLATLAGTKAVPEEVAQSIIAMGDEYGVASPVLAMDEMMMQGGGERAVRGGETQTLSRGDASARMQEFDRSQITPEMMERMRQIGGRESGAVREGATSREGVASRESGAGRTQQGGGMQGRFNEQLQGMLEGLPEDLRAEAERLMSGQGDFRAISEALRDSMRAMGGGGGRRTAGQFMMRSEPDSATTARRIEQLRGKRDSLPDELKAELDRFIEGGASDFRSLSPALMDSIRAWGVLGRGGRQRTPPPADESDISGRYRS
ncbi:MAG: hypothetical protein KAX13_00270, partial [Candidatus Krumholzibacteria bacterium]|nr:hypothetical protein [Candidatus Krumholzibacteria bacterium]